MILKHASQELNLVSSTVIGKSGRKVLLVHGLYASAGAWIQVLKYLKNFRVTLLNINYHSILLNDAFDDLQAEVHEIVKNHFDLIITHSFGGVLIRGVKTPNSAVYHIAPPWLAAGFKKGRYLEFIKSTNESPRIEQRNVVERAIELFGLIPTLDNENHMFVIPDSDDYFYFKSDIKGGTYFPGDHSSLESAVRQIIYKDLIIPACGNTPPETSPHSHRLE